MTKKSKEIFTVELSCPSYSTMEGKIIDHDENSVTISYRKFKSQKQIIKKFLWDQIIYAGFGGDSENDYVVIEEATSAVDTIVGTVSIQDNKMLHVTRNGKEIIINPHYASISTEVEETKTNRIKKKKHREEDDEKPSKKFGSKKPVDNSSW